MDGETIESITVTGEGLTVSLLVWRRFRKQMPGLIERVYDVNPGLSKSGAFLPLGAVVLMPVPPPSSNVVDVEPVRLWG